MNVLISLFLPWPRSSTEAEDEARTEGLWRPASCRSGNKGLWDKKDVVQWEAGCYHASHGFTVSQRRPCTPLGRRVPLPRRTSPEGSQGASVPCNNPPKRQRTRGVMYLTSGQSHWRKFTPQERPLQCFQVFVLWPWMVAHKVWVCAPWCGILSVQKWRGCSVYILETRDFWSDFHLHEVLSKDARRGGRCNIAWMQSTASERTMSVRSTRFTMNTCAHYPFSLNSLGRAHLMHFVTWRYSETVLLRNLEREDVDFHFVPHNCTSFHVASNTSRYFTFSQQEIKLC